MPQSKHSESGRRISRQPGQGRHVIFITLGWVAILFLAIGVRRATAFSFTGTLGSNSATYPGTSGTQTGRLSRVSPAIDCYSVTTFPGFAATASAPPSLASQLITPLRTTHFRVTVNSLLIVS